MKEQTKPPKTLHQLFLQHELRKARSHPKEQAFLLFTYYEALLVAVQYHQWCDACPHQLPLGTINQQVQTLSDQLTRYKADLTISPKEWGIFFQSCRDLFSEHSPCKVCLEQLQHEILTTFHAIQRERTAKKRGE